MIRRRESLVLYKSFSALWGWYKNPTKGYESGFLSTFDVNLVFLRGAFLTFLDFLKDKAISVRSQNGYKFTYCLKSRDAHCMVSFVASA